MKLKRINNKYWFFHSWLLRVHQLTDKSFIFCFRNKQGGYTEFSLTLKDLFLKLSAYLVFILIIITAIIVIIYGGEFQYI